MDTERFDFDTVVPRRGTSSYKWDTPDSDDVLPMWVADMDFQAAPCIREALRHRVDHGIFGYVKVPDAFYEAQIDWFARRHGWLQQREWILYTSGVVPAISALIKALTTPGDQVLVQTPVYNCFFSSIRNNGCQVCESPLLYEDGTYHIDFDDFEAKASLPDVKVFLLCNPHNPAGRVWTADELRKMGDICLRHGVFVISDEIHCELTMPGFTYTHFASLSPQFLLHSATCTSPSKSFNTAGLQIACITIADGLVRKATDKAININEVCDVNPFGVIALIAAYTQGEPWLEALRHYLYANYCHLRQYFEQHLPQIPVTKLEGTYLVWIDCSALGKSSTQLSQQLIDRGRVMLSDGEIYGQHHPPFLRINIACPRQTLDAGLRRIECGLLA